MGRAWGSEAEPTSDTKCNATPRAQQLATEYGLGVDWAMLWDEGQLIAPPDPTKPVGFLTVLGMPSLQELDMPIFESLGGTAEIGVAHLGDRLPWTGIIEVSARRSRGVDTQGCLRAVTRNLCPSTNPRRPSADRHLRCPFPL